MRFYSPENEHELNIMRENFNITDIFGSDVYFDLDKKTLRKTKLLTLKNNELSSIIIRRIIKNSKKVNAEEYLTSKLSYDLSQQIDKEILNKLKNEYNL